LGKKNERPAVGGKGWCRKNIEEKSVSEKKNDRSGLLNDGKK